jgi:N,N-dimethylformamidase beta subunit-like, C-terminal
VDSIVAHDEQRRGGRWSPKDQDHPDTLRTNARLANALLVALAGVSVASALSSCATRVEGRDAGALAGQEPGLRTVEAYFTHESYAPGSEARLVVTSFVPGTSMQVFHVGSVWPQTRYRNEIVGLSVTEPVPVAPYVPIGEWPSGLYFMKLRAPSGDVGYAPFVVRPRVLGEHRVAVVMPTNTWQAYNRRDADGDGKGDTWYENWRIRTIDMTRPFLDHGVPPSFHRYDLPFIRWLALTGKEVDFLTDGDLDQVAGEELVNAYSLIVFPGHHEYVTTREYDAVERYRDLGGNLMFLSANNFFWRVDRDGDYLTKVAQWRNLGRPEAGLIGVQYKANDHGKRRGAYLIRTAAAAEWAFAGTALVVGSAFGSDFGIEIDTTTEASPSSTQVIAEIPQLIGGETAQMIYYETPEGARVFAAGAFTLAGRALDPQVSQVLENIWAHLVEN